MVRTVQKRQLPVEFMSTLMGMKVRMRLVNGDELAGRLARVGQYEVVLVDDDGRQVVVLKHAIAFVYPE